MPPEGDAQAELAELKGQSKYLQETLDQIHRRIDDIEMQVKERKG
jgi:predicted  nucleic acid-binding Zn-ribbon protein